MILFIYLCILVLNVLAVFLTYRFLGENTEKKEKLIFVIVGIAAMYMLVTVVYWLSTNNINLGEGASTAKNLITFAFVPVNAIAILPFLARSYYYAKMGKLQKDQFKNRIILLVVILLVVLIIEFFYFKNIQTGILNITNSRT